MTGIPCSNPRDIEVIYHAARVVFAKTQMRPIAIVKTKEAAERWDRHVKSVAASSVLDDIGIRRFKATYPAIFEFLQNVKAKNGHAFLSDGKGFVYIEAGKSINWWIPDHSVFDEEDMEVLKQKYPPGSRYFWFDERGQLTFRPIEEIVPGTQGFWVEGEHVFIPKTRPLHDDRLKELLDAYTIFVV